MTRALRQAVDASPGRTPKEDLLVSGLDGWADASWVSMSARVSGETDPTMLRDLTLRLITEVLRDGLMVAGDHGGWARAVAQAELERISHEWIVEQGEASPTPGPIVWLSNTAAGDELARAVVEREANGCPRPDSDERASHDRLEP